jgi:competence protein ComEC
MLVAIGWCEMYLRSLGQNFFLLRWLALFLPVLLVIAPTQSANDAPEISIAFIDVGQGDATLIRDGTGFDMLIDGGRKSAGEEIIAYLQTMGVDDLEIVVATHADSDHIGGLITLLESDQIPVENIYFNGYPGDTLTWQEFSSAVIADGLALVPIHYPQNFSWGGFDVQVLNPLENLVDPDQNDVSIVLYVDYAQITVLLPADIDASIEQLLPNRSPNLQADILKIAHHGSKFSSSQAFLEAVQPVEAIISVGANPYGHPAPETLGRLSSIGTHVWRTDLVGTILLRSDGSSYDFLPKIIFLPLLFDFSGIGSTIY